MNTGKIEIIYGEGSGKTAMALGKGLQALAYRKKVIIIQFLKGSQDQDKIGRASCRERVFWWV